MAARRASALAVLLLGGGVLACDPGTTTDEGVLEAVALADQEDAVCGMLVRGQSAPRGQLVHRDGTRLFFCSLGDLLVHLSAPSPHGEVKAVFVEVMEPDEDPLESHPGPHAWLRAEEVTFVVGVPRRGIMGPPVLSYRDAAAAESAVGERDGVRLLDFAGLRGWWSDRQAGASD